MTWVIGSSTAFGYGVLISDIRVTLLWEVKEYDILQKAYPVGDFIVAGLAGSVELGFILLENLRRFLKLPDDAKDCAWDPEWVANNWGPRAKAIYETVPPALQDIGASVLMVGVSPDKDVGIPGWAQSYVCILRSPLFSPEILIGGNKISSIGSGENVNVYAQALKEVDGMNNPLIQLEVGRHGGWAQGIGMHISDILKDNPTPGISQYIQIFVVQRGKITLYEMNETVYPKNSEPIERKMPRVARGYPEFVKMLENVREKATSAIC
jgi:hypothetical protein